jgi:hypothetical protein
MDMLVKAARLATGAGDIASARRIALVVPQ